MKNQTFTRDTAIDSLRGIAIILMVAGHVIGDTTNTGMRVTEESSWRIFYLSLEDLRMPLFTALSGFVYALRPLRDSRYFGKFFIGKARRLLVPLVTVGTLFVFLQTVTPGTNTGGNLRDLWRVYVYGTGHFWFLQSIFIILLFVGIMDALKLLKKHNHLIVLVVATSLFAITSQLFSPITLFSISGAIQLLPFFLLGYWLESSTPPLLPMTTITLSLLFLRFLNVTGTIPLDYLASNILGMIIGLSGISTLFSARERIKLNSLAILGFYSFSIYLLHVFATAPTRMALNRLGVESEITVFLISLTLGLSIPIAFQLSLGRIRWISWLFLGQRPQRH